MVDLAPQVAAQAGAAAAPYTRRHYVLGLLTVVYALNFLDRTIFNVLIEPIKNEFTLSDTTMGLLAGFGFVLFYSLLGIPIARVADRLNRRNIVAIAFAFWSLGIYAIGTYLGVFLGYFIGGYVNQLGGTVHWSGHQAGDMKPVASA